MKTVLLKTMFKSCQKPDKYYPRFRLFEIKDNALEQISSETKLPEIIHEIKRLDKPIVRLNINQLTKEEQKLVKLNGKLEELSPEEKHRFRAYQKRNG